MKVPDKIQILGSEIKTVYEERLLEELSLTGQTNPTFNEIRLRKTVDSREVGDDKKFETWFHEVLHTTLSKIGYDGLSDDETFVTGLSNVLVQIIRQLKK